MRFIRNGIAAVLCLLFLHAFTVDAKAQTYPARTIRLVVPLGPGGPTDILARIIAKELETAWGQTVIVENRPGATGNTGVGFVATTEPDGYTLVLTAFGALTINVTLYGNLTYDPTKDLTPITLVAQIPQLIAVPKDSPVKNVKELVEFIRSKPEGVNYGSPGAGTLNHLSSERFKLLNNLKMTHVPYRGDPQAIEGLLRGDIQMLFGNMSSTMPVYQGGQVKGLAVTGAARWPAVSELPTMTEAGIPGFEGMAWFAVMGPAGIPRDVQTRLNGEIRRILANPEIANRITGLGMQVSTSTPEDLGARIKNEISFYGEVVKSSGAKVQQ